MSTSTSLPGSAQIIAEATPQYPRQSEGDIIALSDGRLFFAWGRKSGPADFDRGAILGMYSGDRGAHWDHNPTPIIAPWGDMTDTMSVSLCRTPRGIHLFFLGQGPDQPRDLRVYQMISTDETATWSAPQQISEKPGYYVVNNARVKRLSSGRLLVPAAYTPGHILEDFNDQRCLCLYSDDDGASWRTGAEVALPGSAMMEPGIAECADGSVYMIIRTAMGRLYEARSWDGGITWEGPSPTTLLSPESPATLLRDPQSDDLWVFWNHNEEAARYNMQQPPTWRNPTNDVGVRNPHAVAVSHDHGRTWGEGVIFEDVPGRTFGYISATIVDDTVILTYDDWLVCDIVFWLMHVRQRIIPLDWLYAHVK